MRLDQAKTFQRCRLEPSRPHLICLVLSCLSLFNCNYSDDGQVLMTRHLGHLANIYLLLPPFPPPSHTQSWCERKGHRFASTSKKSERQQPCSEYGQWLYVVCSSRKISIERQSTDIHRPEPAERRAACVSTFCPHPSSYPASQHSKPPETAGYASFNPWSMTPLEGIKSVSSAMCRLESNTHLPAWRRVET